jgi:alpha-L-rhamnosidase
MFRSIGGINTDGAGFKRIIIRPRPGGKVCWAKAKYESIRGLIGVNWQRQADDLLLKVTIPANSTARVYVPAKSPDQVTEGGVKTDCAEGVEFVRMEGNCALYETGSGDYSFLSSAYVDVKER